MIVERALPCDIENVSAVLNEAASRLRIAGQEMWLPEEIEPQSLISDVNEGLYYLAKLESTVIGVFRYQEEDSVFWPDIPAGQSGFIHRLAIRSTFAGQGYAAQLVDFCSFRTKQLGRLWLRLDCAADRPKLRAIYVRMGFSLHSLRTVGPWHVARYQRRVDLGS